MTTTDVSRETSDYDQCTNAIENARAFLLKSSQDGAGEPSHDEIHQLWDYAHEISISSIGWSSFTNIEQGQLLQAVTLLRREAEIWLNTVCEQPWYQNRAVEMIRTRNQLIETASDLPQRAKPNYEKVTITEIETCERVLKAIADHPEIAFNQDDLNHMLAATTRQLRKHRGMPER